MGQCKDECPKKECDSCQGKCCRLTCRSVSSTPVFDQAFGKCTAGVQVKKHWTQW